MLNLRRSTFSTYVLSILSLLLVALLAGSISCSDGSNPVPDTQPKPPTELYNKVVKRIYRSTVDGAEIPCSVYVPDKGSGYPTRMPVWVDLHAFGNGIDIPIIYWSWAKQLGMICICPWGRNYYGLYTNGKENPDRPEPCFYDDFSSGADGWSGVAGGQWEASQGAYRQSDMSDSWKVACRSDSQGYDYTASAYVTMTDSSSADGNAETSAGLQVRKQADGDCYLAALDYPPDGNKWVHLYRCAGGQLTVLKSTKLPSTFDVAKSHHLKVFTFEENIRVMVDHYKRIDACDGAFSSGGVGLASFGATHVFDNVRVQNEAAYGEQDIIDCINQCTDELSIDNKIRADCSRVFVTGVCVGGQGAWNIGLHYPDLFSHIHATFATTDLAQNYSWIDAQYPDQDGRTYQANQDSNVCAAMRNLVGGREPDSSDVQVSSLMHENSPRYILENALNTPVRIEHPEYDTLVPNTTNPVTIKWRDAAGNIVKVKDGNIRPSSSFAQSQGLWQTWEANPGLYNCVPETSLYDYQTGLPLPITQTLGIWNNYDYSALPSNLYGAHGLATYPQTGVSDDWIYPGKILTAFQRLNARYASLHNDPDDVAYRTYDNNHNRAWWLTMETAYPDQDRPGLARIHRDTTANGINVHVKNVETTTLDVKRMKLDTCTAGKVLTVTVDADTAPESEFKVTDTLHHTYLRLVGEWSPARKGDYQVAVDGNPLDPSSFNMTGATLSIPDIDTTSMRTITITIPAGLENMLAALNPDFEADTLAWSQGTAIFGLFEHNQETYYAHTGGRSIRIKNPVATAEPYIGSWQSGAVSVQVGNTYTLSAFAKTRDLNSVARSYQNARYASGDNSSAKVGITWLNANGEAIGENRSEGINDTCDWTPLEVTAKAPEGATQAKAVLLTDCPNGHGISGSVWFDDVALR